MRVGLISDTHGLMRPEALDALQGSSHIIHAGDVGRPEILDALRAIAPLTVIRGNVDVSDWAQALPETEMVTIEGVCLYVLHNLSDLDLDPAAAGIRVVISGHTHKPKIEERGGVIYINPGAAGARRFTLPVTVGSLSLSADGMIEPRIHTLFV